MDVARSVDNGGIKGVIRCLEKNEVLPVREVAHRSLDLLTLGCIAVVDMHL